jgi:hypothetical protein
MKISATIVSRNDNYGGNLIERSTYCINSSIDTYDEVFYIDWNSEGRSLIYDIKSNLNLKGNLHHIVIEPKIAKILTKYDEYAQKCCEVLGRNIGLRRSTGDWLVSTNIDIISPKRDELISTINELDKNTFYAISRRDVELKTIIEFHNTGKCEYKDWENLREHLINNSEERHFPEKTVNGDDYSLVNCCGDFQIAHKNVWHNIRGFEEELIYPLYADTNIQKKAVKHGFGLKAIYNPAFFHINHGRGGGGFLTGINKKTNDINRAILLQEKTLNEENWGFSDIEIEYEIL